MARALFYACGTRYFKRMNRALLLLILGLLGSVLAAHAEIYTWVDAQGVRHYSDRAAGPQARAADLPGIQTVEGSDAAPAAKNDNAVSARQPQQSRSPELLQPQPQDTIRSAQGVVPIEVSIGDDGLRSGEQVVYYLDGAPVAESPTEALQFQLGGVPRGAHTLSVALLYQGRELRRTDAVTFYMDQPAAITPLNQTAPNAPDNQPQGAATATPAPNVPGVPAAPRFNVQTGAAAPM